MNPTKEQLEQWYVVEKKSIRQIMKLIETKSTRKVPKLLRSYGIEVRHGSDAVKTQWINNDDRRKSIGETFSKAHKGKASHRRLSDREIQLALDKLNLTLVQREVKDGYTYFSAECNECGEIKEMTLKNMFGCRKCANKQRGIEQRTPFEQVKELFDSYGVVLIDTDYERASQPLGYICPKHADLGIQYTSYASAKEFGCCHKCRMERRRIKYGYHPEGREAFKSELKLWRIAVFERDRYTCQCCGDKRGGNLEAHHINNYSSNELLRFDIDNGITLCGKCHNPRYKGSFHNEYGTKDNNEHQLKEYIENKRKSLK